jgi:hypothetical protein
MTKRKAPKVKCACEAKVSATIIGFDKKRVKTQICEKCAEDFIESDESLKKGIAGIEI